MNKQICLYGLEFLYSGCGSYVHNFGIYRVGLQFINGRWDCYIETGDQYSCDGGYKILSVETGDTEQDALKKALSSPEIKDIVSLYNQVNSVRNAG